MFEAASAPPRFKGTTWSTMYPGHGPEVLPVAGHGCCRWKSCFAVSLRAMRPRLSRGQVAQTAGDLREVPETVPVLEALEYRALPFELEALNPLPVVVVVARDGVEFARSVGVRVAVPRGVVACVAVPAGARLYERTAVPFFRMYEPTCSVLFAVLVEVRVPVLRDGTGE
jgi:hypothetical protein